MAIRRTAPRPEGQRDEGPNAARIAALVAAVRALIVKEVPVAREFRYDAYPGDVIAFRLSDSPHDGFCAIVAYEDHVDLVFHRGTELRDVDSLLRGTVAHSRYLELRSASDLRTTRARRYLREALANILDRRPPLAPHAVRRPGEARSRR